jgi:hypothetical protein
MAKKVLEDKKIPFETVNVETREGQNVAARYGIFSLPSVVVENGVGFEIVRGFSKNFGEKVMEIIASYGN